MSFPSIRLFAILFVVSGLLSAVLIHQLNGALAFAIPLTDAASATLSQRVHAIRALGLLFAVLLMLGVVLLASRGARGALALRWVLGAVTSIAFLRATGLVDPLRTHDMLLVAVSTAQLLIEAVAILLLYGEDADGWFRPRSWPRPAERGRRA